MAEPRDIIDMVTRQAEPDLDSWKEQERRQNRSRRNRKLGGFAVAAAIVPIVVVIAAIVSRDSSLVPADDSIVPAPIETPILYTLDLESGEVTALPAALRGQVLYDVSPDGTQITFDSDADVDSKIVVANMDGSDERTFSESGLEVRGPRWSADGSMIVYLAFPSDSGPGRQGPGNLFVLDVATGRSTQITDFPEDPVMFGSFLAPAFSADGALVYYQYPRGTSRVRDLWSVPVTGGKPTLVRKVAAYGEVSPDDTQIAYLRIDPFSEFAGESIKVVGNDPEEQPRTLVEGASIKWPRWSPDGSRIAYADLGVFGDPADPGPGIYVVDVASGETVRVGDGMFAEWLNDHTLVVNNAP